MQLPFSFMPEHQGEKVCRLKKGLYGVKLSPRGWFGKFSKAMVRYGNKWCQSNYTTFIKESGEKVTIFIVCVDDIVLCVDNIVLSVNK